MFTARMGLSFVHMPTSCPAPPILVGVGKLGGAQQDFPAQNTINLITHAQNFMHVTREEEG